MRGARAKRERRQQPDRPNPGRKHGGTHKSGVRQRAADIQGFRERQHAAEERAYSKVIGHTDEEAP